MVASYNLNLRESPTGKSKIKVTITLNPEPLALSINNYRIRMMSRSTSINLDRLLANLPRVLQVQVCHNEFVLELPPDATLLASSARDPHLAFACGPVAWGLQFHPEFNRDVLVSYIQECSDLLRSQGQNPEALIQSATETPYARTLLRRFGQIVEQK